MFRWYFSHRFVDDFATNLVAELSRTLPLEQPKADKVKSQLKHKQRMERAAAFLRQRLEEFHATQRPNLFQKARLSQRLQDGLIARGYPVELAREVALEAIPS